MCSNAYGSSGNYMKDFISNFANHDTKSNKLLEAVMADIKTVCRIFCAELVALCHEGELDLPNALFIFLFMEV